MRNPWLSLWLSAANTWAGAARGFWAAELQRQQTSMIKEMTRPRAPGSGTAAVAKKRRATTARTKAAR